MPKLKHVSSILLLLAVAYTLGVVPMAPSPVSAAPGPFTDVSRHWAAAEINQWRVLGLAGGYGDGTFRPEQATSRAEFLAFANRAFGLVEHGEVLFADVPHSHRWHDDISKAVAAGYISAYADGTFRPDQPLTRYEAGEMLYSILRLEPVDEDRLASLRDTQQLTGDRRVKINAVVAGGYLGGFPDNTLRPDATITRGQMIAILSRASGRIFNRADKFGPVQGTSTLNGNATIIAAGVTLRNITVNGDLFLAQAIADGEVYLQNVTVRGNTWVMGGGSECVIASNQSLLNQATVFDADHNVRLSFDETSSIGTVIWRSGGSYESAYVGGQQPSMEIEAGATGQDIHISGEIASLSVRTGVNLFIGSDSKLQDLDITAAANDSSVEVSGTILSLNVAAQDTTIHITELGKVDTLLTSERLSAAVAGELRFWRAQAPFRLQLHTGGKLQTIEAAVSASGASITRDERSALGTLSLAAGASIQVDGVAQTESGSPPALPSHGTGSSPGTGTIPGSGGTPMEQVRASSAYVSTSRGSITGTITDGVSGTVDLCAYSSDTEIFSMTFTAPVGTRLDIVEIDSPGLGKVTRNDHVDSLTVTVDDLLGPLSTGSVNLGALRALFGGSVTVRGVASHPNYLPTEVTLTVLLK